MDLWQEYFGTPNTGAMAKALRPLVKRHGPRQVLAAWWGYCAREAKGQKWASPANFAGKYLVLRDEWAVEHPTDGGPPHLIPDEPEEVAA